MKQCDLTKGFVVFLTIMITLFCGLMPGAWADEVSDCNICGDEKFEGCYGFSHYGKMITPQSSGNQVPMASVGFIYSDGNGNLTGYETVSLGPPVSILPTFSANITGTYEVNPDCTGTAWICATPDIPNMTLPGTQSVIAFVITSNRKEIQIVTTKMDTSCLPLLDPLNPLVIGDITPINIVGTFESYDD